MQSDVISVGDGAFVEQQSNFKNAFHWKLVKEWREGSNTKMLLGITETLGLFLFV